MSMALACASASAEEKCRGNPARDRAPSSPLQPHVLECPTCKGWMNLIGRGSQTPDQRPKEDEGRECKPLNHCFCALELEERPADDHGLQLSGPWSSRACSRASAPIGLPISARCSR